MGNSIGHQMHPVVTQRAVSCQGALQGQHGQPHVTSPGWDQHSGSQGNGWPDTRGRAPCGLCSATSWFQHSHLRPGTVPGHVPGRHQGWASRTPIHPAAPFTAPVLFPTHLGPSSLVPHREKLPSLDQLLLLVLLCVGGWFLFSQDRGQFWSPGQSAGSGIGGASGLCVRRLVALSICCKLNGFECTLWS